MKKILLLLLITVPLHSVPRATQAAREQKKQRRAEIAGAQSAMRNIVQEFHDDIARERDLEKLASIMARSIKKIQALQVPDAIKQPYIEEIENTYNGIWRIRKLSLSTRVRQAKDSFGHPEEVMEMSKDDQSILEQIVHDFNKGSAAGIPFLPLKRRLKRAENAINATDVPEYMKTLVFEELRRSALDIEEFTQDAPTAQAQPEPTERIKTHSARETPRTQAEEESVEKRVLSRL